jgi:3-oxoacyl-[acyl-carrier protein] reductase
MKRTALVTGFSRRTGIAAAVVERLLGDGLNVMATGWTPHDAEMPWGTDPLGSERLAEHLSEAECLVYSEADLGDPEVPQTLIDATIERFGRIDAVVAVHARSSYGGLDAVTVEELDKCWQVNTRGSLLLAQAFGAAYDGQGEGGRVVFFTSGQHIEAMGSELAYALSKGAIQQMTASVSDQLIERNITVNCVNPGPVDTGWAVGAGHSEIAGRFPLGRWGQPGDVAKLISFLVSPDGGWITGQTLNSEGGFRR